MSAKRELQWRLGNSDADLVKSKEENEYVDLNIIERRSSIDSTCQDVNVHDGKSSYQDSRKSCVAVTSPKGFWTTKKIILAVVVVLTLFTVIAIVVFVQLSQKSDDDNGITSSPISTSTDGQTFDDDYDITPSATTTSTDGQTSDDDNDMTSSTTSSSTDGVWTRARTSKSTELTATTTDILTVTTSTVTPGSTTGILGIGNLALQQSVWQSSEYKDGGNAGLAVDGDKTTVFNINHVVYCTQTATGMSPQWWMLDLGLMYQVSDIVVWGRDDCCWEARIQGLTAAVGQEVTEMHQCGEPFQGPISENPFNFTCKPPLVGRFINISREDLEHISLCEVEVYS